MSKKVFCNQASLDAAAKLGPEFVEKFTGAWGRDFSQLEDYYQMIIAGFAPEEGLDHLYGMLRDSVTGNIPFYGPATIREILEADRDSDVEFELILALKDMDWPLDDWEGFDKYRSEVGKVLGLDLDETTDIIQTFHALNGEKTVDWWKEHFEGKFESSYEFAHKLYKDDVFEELHHHVDWESVTCSLSEGDFTFIELDSGDVAVFREA